MGMARRRRDVSRFSAPRQRGRSPPRLACRRPLLKNKARDLAALRLAVGILGQFRQNADQAWHLERRDTAGKRAREARGIDWLARAVSPWHHSSSDTVADHVMGNRKDAGLLKRS